MLLIIKQKNIVMNTVAEYGEGDSVDVFGVGRVFPVYSRMALGPEDKVLRGTGTGTVGYIFILLAGGGDQTDGMLDDVVGHRHAAYGLLKVEDLLCVEYLVDDLSGVGGSLLDNLHLLVERGVVELDIEHEAVELGFGVARTKNGGWSG